MSELLKVIDRQVQFGDRFTFTDNGDGTATIVPILGTVTELGTNLTAENLNKVTSRVVQLLEDTGNASQLVVSVNGLESYEDVINTVMIIKINADNVVAPTINLNNLGAKTLVKFEDGVITALVQGELKENTYISVVYEPVNDRFVVVTNESNLEKLIKDLRDELLEMAIGTAELRDGVNTTNVSDVGDFGGPVDVVVEGATVNQIVENNNVNSSVIVTSENQRIGINPDGTIGISAGYDTSYQTHDIIQGEKYFIDWALDESSVGLIKNRAFLWYSDHTFDSVGTAVATGLRRYYGSITATKTLKANLKISISSTVGNLIKDYVNVMRVTGNDLLLTDEQLSIKYSKGLPFGLNSVKNFEIERVGINLFNKNAVRAGAYSSVDGSFSPSSNELTTELIRIENQFNYKISGIIGIFRFFYFDQSGNFISTGTSSTGFQNPPENAIYITYQTSITNFPLNIIQIEKGEVATLYKPFNNSKLSFTGELSDVPNGAKNTFNNIDGVNTIDAEVENDTFELSDLISISTGLTNVDIAQTSALFRPDIKLRGNDDVGTIRIGIFNEIPLDDRDDANSIGNYYIATDGRVGFVVAKGTTLSQAQDTYGNQQLVYELATPRTIEEKDFEANGYNVEGLLTTIDNQVNTFSIEADTFNELTTITYNRNFGSAFNDLVAVVEENRNQIDVLKETPQKIIFNSDFKTGWSGEVRIRRSQNNTVNVNIELTKTTDVSALDVGVATLPSIYLPSDIETTLVALLNSSYAPTIATPFVNVEIDTSGNINIIPIQGSTLTGTRSIRCSFNYIAN